MDNWRKVPLGKAFEVQLGKTLSAGSEHGDQYQYLANRNVQWGQIVIDDLRTMHFNLAERERYRLRAGDLLVCEGGEVGRAALWSDELPECYFQNAIHRLRGTGIIDQGFMRHYIEFAAVAGLLRAMTGRTSIGHLPRSKLVRWLVPVPPLEEQRRIAKVLDTLNETVEATKRVIAKRRFIRAGLAADLLNGSSARVTSTNSKPNGALSSPVSTSTSGTSVMTDWESRSIEELVALVSSGGTPTAGDPRYYADCGTPFLKIDDITRSISRFVDQAELSITDLALEESAARIFPAGTVLVTMYGTIGVTKTLLSPMATNQAIAALVPPFRCDPDYLAHALSFRRASLERLAAQTTQPNISGAIIRRFRLPLPPLLEQRRIAEILDTVDSSIHHNRVELAKLRRLRTGLASDLFSGRIRTAAT
ncbi:MAG: restriction endonuclease subunit S [bacterium]|nr:restriction endonuclease subunit S [bacterium]MDE0600227.1 restriction endonuclease subunit S [bacterium]